MMDAPDRCHDNWNKRDRHRDKYDARRKPRLCRLRVARYGQTTETHSSEL
jgi:hypothetical protein